MLEAIEINIDRVSILNLVYVREEDENEDIIQINSDEIEFTPYVLNEYIKLAPVCAALNVKAYVRIVVQI